MIERRKFLKLMGVGTASAVVGNALPDLPALPPPPLPAAEEEMIVGQVITPRIIQGAIKAYKDNPNHVTMSDIGLGVASDFNRIFG